MKECEECGSRNVRVTKVQSDGPDEFYAECCDCGECTRDHISEENAIRDWNDEDLLLERTYVTGRTDNVYIHETSDPDRYKIVASCKTCGGSDTFYISKEQFDRLLKRDETHIPIQDIFPEIPVHIRELFISGTCGLCWIEQMGFETEMEYERYDDIMSILERELIGFNSESFDMSYLIGWYSEWCNNKEEHDLRAMCEVCGIDREDYEHDMKLIIKARDCILNNKVFNKTMFDYPS